MQENAPESAGPREPSYGEKAVGLTFNPSQMPAVDRIKKLYAEIIDSLWNSMGDADDAHEFNRQYEIAIIEAQTAQMWAVKAITWKR